MSEEPQTKKCATCKIEKSMDEFGILRKSEDGHNPRCFTCKRKYDRQYGGAHVDKAKVLDHGFKTDKTKTPDLPKKETVIQYEETVTTEARLIKALKKSAIKSFIKDDLIPMLEKAVEERFE